MLSLLGSQLAVSAASTLARKTFEFSITTSLKGLTDALRERFSNNLQIQALQGELELKIRMLCLPVDLCAHCATRGNTVRGEGRVARACPSRTDPPTPLPPTSAPAISCRRCRSRWAWRWACWATSRRSDRRWWRRTWRGCVRCGCTPCAVACFHPLTQLCCAVLCLAVPCCAVLCWCMRCCVQLSLPFHAAAAPAPPPPPRPPSPLPQAQQDPGGGACGPGGGSPDAGPLAIAAALARRLRELIARLDAVLPYLTLAITAVSLLGECESERVRNGAYRPGVYGKACSASCSAPSPATMPPPTPLTVRGCGLQAAPAAVQRLPPA